MRAAEMGYSRVYVMPEGLLGWKRRGKPLESPALIAADEDAGR